MRVGLFMLHQLTSAAQVQEYRAGSDAAGSAVGELEQQRSKVKAELAEVRSCSVDCCHVS